MLTSPKKMMKFGFVELPAATPATAASVAAETSSSIATTLSSASSLLPCTGYLSISRALYSCALPTSLESSIARELERL